MKRALLPLLLALVLLLSSCTTRYSAEPIEAWVVDAETKQPLAGVNVVAHWQLEGGLEGGANLGQVMVMETVTDGNGKFGFPAWGPKEVPKYDEWWYSNARLTNLDPELLLFKSGYTPMRLFNSKTMEQRGSKGPELRTSDWNGKTIGMERFKGSLEAYADRLSSLNISLEQVAFLRHAELPRDECKWKRIPLMIIAMGKENVMLKDKGIRYRFGSAYEDLLSASSEKYFAEKGCGSSVEFLREHEK